MLEQHESEMVVEVMSLIGGCTAPQRSICTLSGGTREMLLIPAEGLIRRPSRGTPERLVLCPESVLGQRAHSTRQSKGC